MRSAEESEMSVPLVFRLNSRCSESQLGSAGTSSSQPIENCSAPVEGEGSHLQNPRQCSIINGNNMTIMYYNARSLIPKYDELFVTMETHNPDMICIVETWLCDDILNSEIALPGYQLYRRDRNRHGGGVLIYVKDHFVCSMLPSADNLEIITVSVCYGPSKAFISLFYQPMYF